MTLKDSTYARSSDTAMRDLLRRLERDANRYAPARPTEPPSMALFSAPAFSAPEPVAVMVGDWLLHQDPDTGALMATDPDGHDHILATKGP